MDCGACVPCAKAIHQVRHPSSPNLLILLQLVIFVFIFLLLHHWRGSSCWEYHGIYLAVWGCWSTIPCWAVVRTLFFTWLFTWFAPVVVQFHRFILVVFKAVKLHIISLSANHALLVQNLFVLTLNSCSMVWDSVVGWVIYALISSLIPSWTLSMHLLPCDGWTNAYSSFLIQGTRKILNRDGTWLAERISWGMKDGFCPTFADLAHDRVPSLI